MRTYDKPWQDYSDLLALMKSRNLICDDEDKVLMALRDIGYYRLSGYLYPFRVRKRGRKNEPPMDFYLTNTPFELVLDTYVQDQKLRLLILEAVERFEVSLRARVVHELTRSGACSYVSDRTLYSNDFFEKKHKEWLARRRQKFNGARHELAHHHRSVYHPPHALWAVAETWDFGTLTMLTEGLSNSTLELLSETYGLEHPSTFRNILRPIREARNCSAHHARVWNYHFSNIRKPAREALANSPSLAPIARSFPYGEHTPKAKIYPILLLLSYLIQRISPDSTWTERLTEHLEDWEKIQWGPVQLKALGIPQNWRDDLDILHPKPRNAT